MTPTMCREDQQRTLLAEVAQVEVAEASLFARKMLLRAEMDALWNPQDGTFAQKQFGVIELAGTARIGQGRASSQLIDGTRLVSELPGTLAALQAGSMYRETAILLLHLTRNCSPEVTRELERRALPTIVTANTTDVRRLVAQLIPEVEADLDPELTQQRLDEAQAQAHVAVYERPNAMVGITAEVDVLSGRRWALDFEELVRAQKVADDKAGVMRTQEQRRAAVFVQLPSRFLALVLAIQRGDSEQLCALAQADPELADDLEALAASLPIVSDPCAGDPSAPTPSSPEPLDVDLAVAGHDVPMDLLEELPIPPEPPPDWARDADPPDRDLTGRH